MTRFVASAASACLAVCSSLCILNGAAFAQNTIGGDVFAPGEADFVQNGSEVGRGPAFQFSDAFYLANGIDPDELRAQELASPNPAAPNRFHAFYRGEGDVFVADGDAPDARFIDDTRITIHNMGFNAAGEQLFYPDPPSFFFESAFLDQDTKDLTNRSFVFLFPRTEPGPNTVMGCEGLPTSGDLLNPAPCQPASRQHLRHRQRLPDEQPAATVADHVRDLGRTRRCHAGLPGRDGDTGGAQRSRHRRYADSRDRSRGARRGWPRRHRRPGSQRGGRFERAAGQRSAEPGSARHHPRRRVRSRRRDLCHRAHPPSGGRVRRTGVADQHAGRSALCGLTDPHRPPCGVCDG